VAEVVRMTGPFGTVESLGLSSSTRRDGKVSKRTESLDDLLLAAVDDSLRQVFREEGVDVIYNFVENKCHLRREEIVEKPEAFSAGLRKLLVSGAPLVEKMILENLYSKLELKFEEREGYEFSDYIGELKKILA